MGPPSSGALTVGQILRLVERFDIQNLGSSAEGMHLILEASRLAFADRARYMADSDFVPVPVEGLLNTDYLRARSQLIQLEATIGKALPGRPPGFTTAQASMHQIEPAGTSHFSIVDSRGNIVSMTTTIESGFGSMLMTQGFLLNNEMTDFSFRASKDGLPVANRVEGGKRPRSSMAPTIVFDSRGAPILVAGSPGGSRIICYVAQALIGVLDWNMNPQQAVSMPHFCNRNGPTDLESHHDAAALKTVLTDLGHEVRVRDMNSGLHMIQLLPSGELLGGADPRREGLALGE
jgi:gamma-glutamyltranspeptidase/glutathione hydrolase